MANRYVESPAFVNPKMKEKAANLADWGLSSNDH